MKWDATGVRKKKKKNEHDVKAAQTKGMEWGEEGQMGVKVRDCG